MKIKQLVSALKKDRGNWETLWQDVSDKVMPDQADFNTTNSQADRRTNRIYDTTAANAVMHSASALSALVMPEQQKWHGLRTTDEDLNKDREVRMYFDEVTRLLFSYRSVFGSNHAASNHEAFRSLMGLGTGCRSVMPHPSGKGFVYQAHHMSSMYFGQSNLGMIDTALREMKMTRQRLINEFGEENMPDEVMRDDGAKEFTVGHLVYPNDLYDPQNPLPQGRKFKSIYYVGDCEKKDNIILEEGLYEFPYAVCRDKRSPIEVYGRSPAITMLPEIKALNEYRKTNIRAAHKLVDPPLLAPSRGALGVGGMNGGINIRMTPNAINYGGVNAEGRQMIIPMQTGARPDIAQAMIEDSRNQINQGFLITLFEILAQDRREMTATEVLERAKEKGILLAPVASMLESDYTGVQIERELGILARQGILPEIPQILLEAGGDYQVKYESPLVKAQRAPELLAIDRVMQRAAQMASFDPSIMDNFDMDEAFKEVAEIEGLPEKILRSSEEKEEMRNARAEAEQAAFQTEQAVQMSGAARNLAEAGETAGSLQ